MLSLSCGEEGREVRQQLGVVYRCNVWHAGYLQAGNVIEERYASLPRMNDSSRNVMVIARINEGFGTVAKTFGVPGSERWNKARPWWPVDRVVYGLDQLPWNGGLPQEGIVRVGGEFAEPLKRLHALQQLHGADEQLRIMRPVLQSFEP